jgi:hypothetical protein
VSSARLLGNDEAEGSRHDLIKHDRNFLQKLRETTKKYRNILYAITLHVIGEEYKLLRSYLYNFIRKVR